MTAFQILLMHFEVGTTTITITIIIFLISIILIRLFSPTLTARVFAERCASQLAWSWQCFAFDRAYTHSCTTTAVIHNGAATAVARPPACHANVCHTMGEQRRAHTTLTTVTTMTVTTVTTATQPMTQRQA